MAYTKKEWKDKPSKETPITAEELNRMEDGISWLHEQIEGLESILDEINGEEV